jgi:dTDP-4-dehydrorhamnose 3,5-epimerase
MDEITIKGVKCASLEIFADSRGSVMHFIKKSSPEFIDFGECYISEVLVGKVKGWKKHSLQTQNLVVPVGKIRFILYDKRYLSDTYGEFNIIEIGRPDSYKRLTIPPGIWYSFCNISNIDSLIVNCADKQHDPLESESLKLDSIEIPFDWKSKI